MKIEEIRKKTGLNRSEFAKFLGIPYRTVQAWELGDRKVADYMIDLIRCKVEYEFKKKEKE